jgi:Fur family transcriptional regulator, ferric uptake regulator
MTTGSRELHETVEGRLRRVGQRYTPNRRALVGALLQARGPVSIGDLPVGKRAVPQSSAYRNLAVLEQAGVIRRVITDDDFARFELDEDLTEHHHHLVCSNCGRIEDVEIPANVERSIGRTFDRVAKGAGFASVDHRLDLIGRCRSCA